MAEDLKRVLGFWSCLAVAVGLVVASSTLVSLGQGFGLAGSGFVIAMIGAWLLMLVTAMSYGELGTMLPRAGGISTYTLVAMGPLPAIVATFCGYLVVNVLAGPVELYVSGLTFTDTLAGWCPPMAFSIALLIVLTILNLVGVDIFAKAQLALTVFMMGSMLLMGLMGLAEMGSTAPNIAGPESFNPMGWGVFALVALGIWLFIGIEFVTPMAEETINPGRNIPWSMFIGLIIILVIKMVFGFASIKFVPLDKLAESATPHVDAARAMLGEPGAIWIGLIGITATASSVNTLLAAVPRLFYGMAHSGELPAIFKWVHPRFATPWWGIIGFAIAMFVVLVSGLAGTEQVLVYLLAAAWTWMLCYIISHVDLMIIRSRYPNAERPYRSPLYPLPQILGILGFAYVMYDIYPDPVVKFQIVKVGLYFLIGSVIYGLFWIKLKMKTGYFKPITLEKAMEE